MFGRAGKLLRESSVAAARETRCESVGGRDGIRARQGVRRGFG